MSRKLPLIPTKTPLHPDDAEMVKGVQLELKAAREHVDTMRPPTARESPHIIDLINSIGFIKVRLVDGAAVAIRFVAGIRHPDTDLNYYIAVDPEMADAVDASEFADHRWRADEAENGNIIIRAQQTADTTTAARILYQLSRPDVTLRSGARVSVKDDGSGHRNPLDLRTCNLEVPDLAYTGGASEVPDLKPFGERIAALISNRCDN